MAHKVENMFSVLETPWHELGRVLQTNPQTVEDALREAGLDWRVSLEPVYNAKGLQIERSRAVTRSTDGKALGIVGMRYRPVQNIDALGSLDHAVQDGTAKWETAGSLDGGRKVWGLVRLGETFEPVKNDPVCTYGLVTNSHDGSSVARLCLTPIRVVCNNTLTAALASTKRSESVRHTASASARLDEASRALGLLRDRISNTREAYKALASRTLTSEMLKAYIGELFPIQADSESKRGENIQSRIFELIEGGKGSDIVGVRGTAWGAYNAVTEYVDHERSTRSSVGESEALSRFESANFGAGLIIKKRAFELALVAS